MNNFIIVISLEFYYKLPQQQIIIHTAEHTDTHWSRTTATAAAHKRRREVPRSPTGRIELLQQ